MRGLRERNEWKFFSVLPRADPILAAAWWLALVLRGAPNMAKASLDSARTLAEGALGQDPSGDRHEFISLLAKARALTPATAAIATRAQ